MREEVIGCSVEWCREHEMGVRVSPRVFEEKLEGVTDGEAGKVGKIDGVV